MTAAWVVMGVLVTAGFFSVRADAQARCRAGNELRREALPAAFELSHRRIGEALRASPDQIAEFDAGFQADLDRLFPERDCPLLW